MGSRPGSVSDRNREYSRPLPTASLPALGHRLEARLLELDRLHQTRPGLPTAMARAEAGQRIDELLDEIAELQRMIDASPAETLQDAAVKLRRLEAYVDRGQPARLLAGALRAVGRVAAVDSGPRPRSWGACGGWRGLLLRVLNGRRRACRIYRSGRPRWPSLQGYRAPPQLPSAAA